MKSVAVTDEVVCKTNSSGKKRVINRSETILAIEKQNKMIKMFQKWIWEDERRKERLEMIFENNFSCVRKRIFDGSFLRFPEIVSCIKAHFRKIVTKFLCDYCILIFNVIKQNCETKLNFFTIFSMYFYLGKNAGSNITCFYGD